MTAIITITSTALSGSSTKIILCDGVTVGFKRDVDLKPNANGGTLAYAQTQGQENPTISLRNVQFNGGTNVLTYTDLLALSKINYDGSNAPTLQVNYGPSSQLVGFNGSTTSIPVVIKDFTFNIDARDTKDGYLPSASINLVETR
jgi:hypothetical protein